MFLDFFGLSKVFLRYVSRLLKVLPGTRIALIPRKPFLPSHVLALSIAAPRSTLESKVPKVPTT